MSKLKSLFNAIYFSLPVRLLVRQIQHHKVLLIFWVILLGVLSGWIGKNFGAAYLLLEPEYLGREDFWSLFIIGSSLGGFLFAYMVTLYISESYQFPFISHTRSPFYVLSYNNFLVPGSLLILYFYTFIHYHTELAGGLTSEVLYKIAGLTLGITVVFLLIATYFFARRGLLSRYGKKVEEQMAQRRGQQNSRVILDRARESMKFHQRTHSFLTFPWKISRVNPDTSPHFREVVGILNQHHGKLLVLQVVTFVLIGILGLLEENRFFQIPAGASYLLISALGIMLMGAITFWFRKTGAFTVLAFLAFIGLYNQFDLFKEQNQAFGMDYEVAPAPYTQEHLRSLTEDSIYWSDRATTLRALENWKRDYQEKYGRDSRPRLVLVTASGGGLRSAFWTFRIMQELDEVSHGRILDETRLMTGASGGMLGLTYFRELYWRQQQGEPINLGNPEYRENMSKDLLNRVLFNMFTDILLPTQKVTLDGRKYDQERGYSFDQQLASNLPELAGRRLGHYHNAEVNGDIPFLVLSPTAINQGRQLYISASPVSYLARPSRISEGLLSRSRGLEFRRFFRNHQPDSLMMTTAMRMNASFPVILPVVELPSVPSMEIMDAGAIDNYGTQTAVKFVVEFKSWLAKNTSGVLLLQIRDNDRLDPIRQPNHSTLSSLITPIDGGYYSMAQAKDVSNDYLLEFLKEWYPGDLEVMAIEYPKESADDRFVSLSLHLTGREKQRLESGVYTEQNKLAFSTLKTWYLPTFLADQHRK